MDTREISFEDIIKSNFYPAASLAEDINIFDVEHLEPKHILNPEFSPPIRINAHAIILCKYGELSISVNYTTYRLNKGSALRLSNFHTVDNIRVNNNCEATVIVFSQNFTMSMPVIKKMIKNHKSSPEIYLKLGNDEMRTLTDFLQRIKNYLKRTDHAFHSYIVKNEASNFCMEFANITLQRANTPNKRTDKECRRDEIFRDFMQLLMNNFKEQHEVAYYANELHTTPGNLSQYVISVSGKSPIQHIGNMLVAEAKTLLRKPNATIKQVADELYFGNQSSFGKFFKKHTGMTPVEYKNKGKGEK
ncbi:MAG: helix-turn-helix domain-containing protein [Tannerella sp.]|jgi:AraC-like DNA-binding protein|nr:helix-turn-helix domain-containing protein [Tannerella sp.]